MLTPLAAMKTAGYCSVGRVVVGRPCGGVDDGRASAGMGDRVSDSERTAAGIAFDRSGSGGGVPVLLLHAGVADRRMWDPQWPALAAERDVIRVDLRGFGGSTLSTAPGGSSFSHLDDVTGTLVELGVDTCHVVGASLGAGVATELALGGVVQVRTLLLCPPGGSLFGALTPDLREFIDAENDALERGDLDAAVQVNVSTWVIGPGRQASDVDPAVQDAVRRMQRRAFEVTSDWGDDVEEVDPEPPTRERLAELRSPVHVLVGGHDLAATREAASRVCAAVPGATRTDWPDAAHLPSMEHPGRFLDLLRDWINTPQNT